MDRSEFERRAQTFVQPRRIKLVDILGEGTDGCVWKSDRPSAVKVFERRPNYLIELACYQRLAKKRVDKIQGFNVPVLIDYSDELLVVEMSVVRRPYLLDFAKSHIDTPPEFPADKWQTWHEDGIEMFGNDRWPTVRTLVAALAGHGIHYFDVRPGNIMFLDWENE